MSRLRDNQDIVFCIAIFLASLVLATGFSVIDAYFEARAFNNATGKNVSTLDALFLELRVQEQAK